MRGREEPTPSPKVSIGMPVYNARKYIREALDSLLAQTFASFELSISDNASTDGIKAIAWGIAPRTCVSAMCDKAKTLVRWPTFSLS